MPLFKKISTFCIQIAEAYNEALCECNPYYMEKPKKGKKTD